MADLLVALCLSFRPVFAESDEEEAGEGKCDEAGRIEPVKLADVSV